jgi:hypothetical protein
VPEASQFPARALPEATYHDRRTVRLADNRLLPLTEAIDRLPWVPMLCPTMPHQYVVSGWGAVEPTDLAAILAMIRDSPDTRLAYWRGYQTPNRYWHGPDGFRYWTSPAFSKAEFCLNRTDDVDDTRAVDDGEQPIKNWGGCPWEPQGSQIYERVKVNGRYGWWPTAAALTAGYKPCRACQRRPPETWSPDDRQLLGLGR